MTSRRARALAPEGRRSFSFVLDVSWKGTSQKEGVGLCGGFQEGGTSLHGSGNAIVGCDSRRETFSGAKPGRRHPAGRRNR